MMLEAYKEGGDSALSQVISQAVPQSPSSQGESEPSQLPKDDMMTALIIASGYAEWLGLEPQQAMQILVEFIHNRAGAVDEGSQPQEPVQSPQPIQKSVVVVISKALDRRGNEDVQRLANEYRQSRNIQSPPHTPAKHDPETAMRIADAYDEMEHSPYETKTARAYAALKSEVLAQYNHAVANGYRFEPQLDNDNEPYANSAEMMKDVRDNKHLLYYPTITAFGGDGDFRSDNPLLESTGLKQGSHNVLYNDAFRAVHDLYGHATHGYQFGAKGEENAWRAHSSMFTPEANAALTSETRGQNSWVNFGKHMRTLNGQVPKEGEEGFVPANQRPFAEQKIGLLPSEFHQPLTETSLKKGLGDEDGDDEQGEFEAMQLRRRMCRGGV